MVVWYVDFGGQSIGRVCKCMKRMTVLEPACKYQGMSRCRRYTKENRLAVPDFDIFISHSGVLCLPRFLCRKSYQRVIWGSGAAEHRGSRGRRPYIVVCGSISWQKRQLTQFMSVPIGCLRGARTLCRPMWASGNGDHAGGRWSLKLTPLRPQAPDG